MTQGFMLPDGSTFNMVTELVGGGFLVVIKIVDPAGMEISVALSPAATTSIANALKQEAKDCAFKRERIQDEKLATATSKFKKDDRVVYRDSFTEEAQDGTVTSVNEHTVFVCYGLPGSTSQATDPADLTHLGPLGRS